jgi:hypothetical protein
MTARLKQCLGELADEVRLVDMHERVVRGSRRAKVRNWVVVSIAATAAMSGTVAGVASIRLEPVPPQPNPSVTPSIKQSNVNIRNARFDVPEFPGGDGWCPAATRSFGNGYVRTGGQADNAIALRMIGEPVRADIDGQPGDEILIELDCHAPAGLSRGQVLAVKISPEGEYVSMGFVLRSPDHPTFMVHDGSVRVEHGTILVEVLGPNQDAVMRVFDLQTRGYAYRNGEFVQVSGPTRFADPPSGYRRVDFRNVTACVALPHPRDGVRLGVTRISDGKGTVTIDGVLYDLTVVSSVLFTQRPYGVALYRLEPRSEPRVPGSPPKPITVVNSYRMYDSVPVPCGVDTTALVGIDGATKVEASGGLLNVTVNGTVRTYREEMPGDLRWVRSA